MQTWYLVDELNPPGYAQLLEERVSASGAPSLTTTPTVSYVYGLDLISQKRSATVHYYGNASRWPDILAANRDVLKNEKSLLVGTKLKIP